MDDKEKPLNWLTNLESSNQIGQKLKRKHIFIAGMSLIVKTKQEQNKKPIPTKGDKSQLDIFMISLVHDCKMCFSHLWLSTIILSLIQEGAF